MEEKIEIINAAYLKRVYYCEVEKYTKRPFFQLILQYMDLNMEDHPVQIIMLVYPYNFDNGVFSKQKVRERLVNDMMTIGLAISNKAAIKVVIDRINADGYMEAKEIEMIK